MLFLGCPSQRFHLNWPGLGGFQKTIQMILICSSFEQLGAHTRHRKVCATLPGAIIFQECPLKSRPNSRIARKVVGNLRLCRCFYDQASWGTWSSPHKYSTSSYIMVMGELFHNLPCLPLSRETCFVGTHCLMNKTKVSQI